MDAKELRNKTAAELNDELFKLRKEQFALRLQRATGQAPKPDQFGKVRAQHRAREDRPAPAARKTRWREEVSDNESNTAPAAAEAKGARTLTGRVVSNKMQKTIAVEIERLVKHPHVRQVRAAHDQAPGSRRERRVPRRRPRDHHALPAALAAQVLAAGRRWSRRPSGR